MLEDLPVFGVCGYSGSGKTTLLETVVSRLVQRGFQVAVVKHDVHGIDRDKPDKDSDRLFCVGADVAVHGPGGNAYSFSPLRRLPPGDYDQSPGSPLRPGFAGGFQTGEAGRPGCCNLASRLHPPISARASRSCQGNRIAGHPGGHVDPIRRGTVRSYPRLWVCSCWRGQPANGASETPADAGGRNRRDLAAPNDSDLATLLSTSGASRMCGDPRGPSPPAALPDSPGVNGPLAGLLSAMRWAPRVGWLLTACDMPFLSREAVAWLLTQRRPGVWAAIPRVSERRPVEPLLAWYGFRCRDIIEALARAARFALRDVADHPKCRAISRPFRSACAWQDVDTPGDAASDCGKDVHHRTAGS